MKYLLLIPLVTLGVLFALWLWRRRLHPLAALGEDLSAMRLKQPPGDVLASTLERIKSFLGATSALMCFYDAEEEKVYRWSSERREGRHSEPPQRENPLWIDFSVPQGIERLVGSHPLLERLGAREAISVSCAAEGKCARLILVDPAKDYGATLDPRLERLAGLLFDLADRVFLLERVRSQAVDEERSRIAQDFHDGPLQTFFGFDVQLQVIRRILAQDPERAVQELDSLQQLARRQGRELRDLLQEMRPMDREGTTLINLVRNLVEDSQKSGGLSVRLLTEAPNLVVPRKIRRQTYQVLREALNNARKHAQAQHVVVSLEESPGFFTLTIDDDGKGFQFSGRHSLEEMDHLKIGPVSIKQRARQMGADLTLESTPGHGARLILKVPVPPASGSGEVETGSRGMRSSGNA